MRKSNGHSTATNPTYGHAVGRVPTALVVSAFGRLSFTFNAILFTF